MAGDALRARRKRLRILYKQFGFYFLFSSSFIIVVQGRTRMAGGSVALTVTLSA